MSIDNESSLQTSCDDCRLFVSCKDGIETDNEIIAYLESTKILRDRFLAEDVQVNGADNGARSIRQLDFDIWVMKNETYIGDPEGLTAALNKMSEKYAAEIALVQSDPNKGIFDTIADQRIELDKALVRKRYREVLTKAVKEKGCEGPQFKRVGFLGRKVIDICHAPITEVEKLLAKKPPFSDLTET